MTLKSIPVIPGWGNLPLRCQATRRPPLCDRDGLRVALLLGVGACGRGRSRGTKSLRFAGRARHGAGAGLIEGH